MTAGIGLVGVLVLLTYPKRWAARVPASLVVIVAVAVAARWLHLPLETIVERFGEVPRGLPPFVLPAINLELVGELLPTAFTIAMLGAIESLLSAVVADGMIDDQHDSNQELVGQGVANIVSPFFGGIPATGAIARTAANVRTGAASPVAGIVHAGVLLLIVLVLAPLVEQVPLVALSAILIVVGYHMGEWHEFRRLRRMPRSDAVVFLISFVLTLVTDLTVAVEVGVILAALLFVKRISAISEVQALGDSLTPSQGFHVPRKVPAGVQVYRLQGAFFFGTVDRLELALRRGQQEARVLVLSLDQVITMDGTGLNALENLAERLRKRRQRLILCGVHPRVGRILHTAQFLHRLGPDNVYPTLDAALESLESPAASA